MKVATAYANANIALVKYWGKTCAKQNIPAVSSLSMTLDNLGTTTTVAISKNDRDSLLINDKDADDDANLRLSSFLNHFRKTYSIKENFNVITKNSIPYKAGLASSASAFASLSIAIAHLLELNLTKSTLSCLARFGSASAARSIFGGFVSLTGGPSVSNLEALASPIEVDKNLDLAMIIVLINQSEKALSSRQAMMITKQSSPFYKSFVDSHYDDFAKASTALKNGLFAELGEAMEHSTMKMHASMWAAQPAINYLMGLSLEIINFVYELRKEYGPICFFTMDAGPNVKLLVEKKHVDLIIKQLLKFESEISILQTQPGAAAHICGDHLG